MLNIASAVARCRSLTTTVPVLLAIGFVPSVAFAQAPAQADPTPAANPAPAPGTPALGVSGTATAGSSAGDPAAAPASGTPVATDGAEGATATDAPADSTEADERAEAKRWAARDAALRETGTLTGGTGLLHMQHAESGEVGQMRLGFTYEYFSASFLCTNAFPCPTSTAQKIIGGDNMTHSGGTLSIGATLVKTGETGRLEGYASTGAYSNSDSANQPSLLQITGDVTLGLKYSARAGHTPLHLGLYSELLLVNGSGALGFDWGATSARFGGIATLDLRDLESKTPLRMSASLDYMLDNTGKVLESTESAQGGVPVTRIERFGLDVNRVDHVDIHLGLEALLLNERIRPFAELSILAPTNRGQTQYYCHPDNPSGDQCLKYDHDVPTTLTFGGRFYPWKEGFSVTAAMDVGLTGVANFIEELAPNPPWMLYIGAGWAFDTQTRPPVVKTKLVEKRVEIGSVAHHVKGFVHEKDKGEGLAGAIVAYDNHPDLNALLSGPDGRWTSQDLAEGTYTLNVKLDGYHPATCEVTVTKELEAPVDCALEALPRVGTVVGHLRDADTNAPLPNMSIRVVDVARKEHMITSDASGAFRIEGLPPGNAEFGVTATGYLALVSPGEVKARQEITNDLLLRAKPKASAVKVEAKEITIKQQIQFALDSAVILPESFGLLSEIADTLIRETRIHRVEIQGHTDNSGSADHNKLLSDQRAEAVRVWLQQHGVGGERLVSTGYGQDKPLVPNVTPGNRAKNRRVQFIIVEQDAATPATK